MRLIRWIEIVLGVTFVAAAMLKALDVDLFAMQIAFYGVLRARPGLQLIAWGAVVVETLLGAALLTGYRAWGWVLRATAAMLAGFTGLIIYAWVFHDLEDCGCFGGFLRMGPGPSLLKNVAMLALIGWVWRKYGWGLERLPAFLVPAADGVTAEWRQTGRHAVTGLCVVLVTACYLYGPGRQRPASTFVQSATPFAQFQYTVSEPRLGLSGKAYDLSSGDFIVAMLSATCTDCKKEVAELNALALDEGVPPLIGLTHGTQAQLEAFRAETDPMFPTVLLEDVFAFLALIGESTPRVYVVRDGAPLRYWDEHAPTVQELLNVTATPGEGS